jgi:CBS domain-containing protein
MNVGDVMTTGAATVWPDAPLAEAARIMVEHRISGLPVVDASGQLVGVITEGDFLRRPNGERDRWISVLLRETNAQITAQELQGRRVDEVMSRNPISVGVETPIDEVLDLMERQRVKRVPVVCSGKVVGIVSRANLIQALMRRANRPATWSGG